MLSILNADILLDNKVQEDSCVAPRTQYARCLFEGVLLGCSGGCVEYTFEGGRFISLCWVLD